MNSCFYFLYIFKQINVLITMKYSKTYLKKEKSKKMLEKAIKTWGSPRGPPPGMGRQVLEAHVLEAHGSLRPMPLGPHGAPTFFWKKIHKFLKSKIAKKAYIPPTLLKIKVYDIEPRLKVYIPVFQPPGHSSDGLGLY